MKLTDVTNIGY